MSTYTQQQAVSIFCQYALYIHQDVVLESDVREILTDRAVTDARIAALRSGDPKDYFVDWETMDGKIITLFTLHGFLEAVSWHNANECQQKAKGRARKPAGNAERGKDGRKDKASQPHLA